MRNLILLCCLTLFVSPSWAQSIVPSVTKINHAWVDGVYWNPELLPGWGFFVDVQEETIFGAIYGYQDGNATFITLQGTVSVADPLEFRGNVYSVSNSGNTATDVGNFTWSVRTFEASPASYLTISSNILNRTNLHLRRFSYTEIDKIDMLTAGDWNIVTSIISSRSAYSYAIVDDRVEQDGKTFAVIIHNTQPDEVGVIAYFPPGEGDAYGFMIPFLGDTNQFAVFNASDTEMYGRFWLLDPDESPSGNGYYMQAAADTMQASDQVMGILNSHEPAFRLEAERSALLDAEINQLMLYDQSEMEQEPMFSEDVVHGIYTELKDHLARDHRK